MEESTQKKNFDNTITVNFDGAQTNLGIDQLIKKYLQANGYESAAVAMEEDMNKRQGTAPSTENSTMDMLRSGNPEAADPSKVDELKLIEAVYIKALHDSDFSVYVTELDNFSSWVLASFDSVKTYLIAVLFAIFCHCYIAMIRNGAVEPAFHLFSRYKDYFLHSFAPELHRLSLLQSPDQLDDMDFIAGNKFLQSILTTRFKIRMTPLALQVVSQKLRQDNLIMMATVINQKIVFDKIEPVDPTIIENDIHESCSLISLPGYNPDQTTDKEATRLVLGVAGMGDVAKYWKERSALFNDIDFPDILHDPLLQAWSEKLIRPRSILKKLARKDGSIPIDEKGVDQMLQHADNHYSKLHLSNSATSSSSAYENSMNSNSHASSSAIDDSFVPGKYGDTLNPSIICATIGNAYDHLTCMDVSPNISQIATGHHDKIVRVWRVDQSSEEQKYEPWFGRNLPAPFQWEMNKVLPVPLSNDHSETHSVVGNKSYVSNHSSSLQNSKPVAFPCIDFVGHSMPVYSVAQSECERFVYSGSGDDTIRIWDTSVVQCVGRYQCLSTPWSVKSSPIDAHYFAAGHADRTVSVYTMDRSTPVRLMTGHTSDVNVVSWHGNGVLLASGSDDRSARLWDMRSADCVRIFRHCASPITALQVSSLGTLLAAGTEHGKIYVWDIRSSRQLAILQGHTEEVTSLSFSKDRTQALCSGAMDCSVRVWDLRLALETAYNPTPSSAPAIGSHRSAQLSANIDAAHLPSAQTHDYSVCVLKARNAFFTKACPIFNVGYTDKGMVYCGGMYSASTASALREKNVAENSTAVAEQMLIKSFGMSSAVPTKSVTSSGML